MTFESILFLSAYKCLNKHKPEANKIYGGFLKILIFRASLPGTHLQSKTFLFYIQSYKLKLKLIC